CVISTVSQKPTRFPYSCHAQFGMSGSGEPPAGGVKTVRGMGSRGFHSSTLTMTHTIRRPPPGRDRQGRSLIAEYAVRSLGSIVTPPENVQGTSNSQIASFALWRFSTEVLRLITTVKFILDRKTRTGLYTA